MSVEAVVARMGQIQMTIDTLSPRGMPIRSMAAPAAPPAAAGGGAAGSGAAGTGSQSFDEVLSGLVGAPGGPGTAGGGGTPSVAASPGGAPGPAEASALAAPNAAAPASGTSGSSSASSSSGATAAAAGASAASATTGASSASVTSRTSAGGDAVVQTARKYLGVPYKWGGTNPNVGLDCSGLVQLVFKELGVTMPRVARDQAKEGTEIPSLAQAKPGDLLGMRNGSHIAIYLGDNKILHAPRPGEDVSIRSLYSSDDIDTIRRVVPAGSGTASAGADGSTRAAFDRLAGASS